MDLVLPGFEANAALAPFAAVAVAMVAITLLVLGLVLVPERRAPLVTQMLLAVTVIGGGSVLLVALLFVFLNPNGTDSWTWVLTAFNFMMMFPIGLWFVGLIVWRDRRVADRGWAWPLALGLATTGSEVLMGILFAVGGGSTPTPSSSLGNGLSSVWFYWSMAAVMGGLLVWARLLPAERAVARGLLATSLAAPWVAAFPVEGGVAVTCAMVFVLGSVLVLLARRRVQPAELPFLLAVSAAFLAMTLSGLALAVSGGTDAARIAFGSVMACVMGGEIAFLARSCYTVPAPAPEAAAVTTSSPAHEISGA